MALIKKNIQIALKYLLKFLLRSVRNNIGTGNGFDVQEFNEYVLMYSSFM